MWNQIADFTLAAIIADGSITSAKLANGPVIASVIADGSISNSKLAPGSVDNTKLAASAVTFSKMLASHIQAPLANLLLPVGLGPFPWHLPDLPAQGGWDWADGGVLLSNSPFTALRAALIAAGFPHGQDGSGNPYKPDARGRVIACVDDLGSGAAGRLTSVSISGGALLGKNGGQEAVTLTNAQIPSHQHAVYLRDPGHTHSITGAVFGGSGSAGVGGGAIDAVMNHIGIAATTNVTNLTIGSVNGVANDNQTASAGGGGSHTNVQPTLVCK